MLIACITERDLGITFVILPHTLMLLLLLILLFKTYFSPVVEAVTAVSQGDGEKAAGGIQSIASLFPLKVGGVSRSAMNERHLNKSIQDGCSQASTANTDSEDLGACLTILQDLQVMFYLLHHPFPTLRSQREPWGSMGTCSGS